MRAALARNVSLPLSAVSVLSIEICLVNLMRASQRPAVPLPGQDGIRWGELRQANLPVMIDEPELLRLGARDTFRRHAGVDSKDE